MLRNSLQVNKSRRFFFKYVEVRLKVLKYTLKSMLCLFKLEYRLKYNVSKLHCEYFSTNINSMCVLTGRQRSIYKYFRMSKIALKKSVGDNLIYGIRKSSW